jgi:hypothetical protein
MGQNLRGRPTRTVRVQPAMTRPQNKAGLVWPTWNWARPRDCARVYVEHAQCMPHRPERVQRMHRGAALAGLPAANP